MHTVIASDRGADILGRAPLDEHPMFDEQMTGLGVDGLLCHQLFFPSRDRKNGHQSSW